MPERVLHLDDGTQANWSQYLDEFEETMWPIFETRGYGRDAALTVWMLNRVVNHLQPHNTSEDADGG